MRRRNKKEERTYPFVRYILLGLIGLFLISLGAVKIGQAVKASDRFIVKKVVLNPSISFIKTHTLSSLKGKNIFDLDIQKINKKLRYQYPQVSNLKVMRRFPDQIYVSAKARNAVAQVRIKKEYAVVDDDGVVLAVLFAPEKGLPAIHHIRPRQPHVKPGIPLIGKNIQVALDIVEGFKSNQNLKENNILWVDIANLSKITIYLDNEITAILDQGKIMHKLRILGILLKQRKIELKDIKYIDLRFSEPVIKKK